jgi:F-type H+-transporting ATPase subunit delta
LPETGPSGRRGLRKKNGRVHVSETASISSSIAARYAQALFDLSKEDSALATLEQDTDALSNALDASEELRAAIASPLHRREEMAGTMRALGDKAGLSQLTTNTLVLLAEKRRTFVLPQFVAALQARIAEEKGEVTADVISAKPLSDAQKSELAATLKQTVGKDIKLNSTVDERLIGGLVVKVGSRMIDTSIKTKLANLQNAMKEVG